MREKLIVRDEFGEKYLELKAGDKFFFEIWGFNFGGVGQITRKGNIILKSHKGEIVSKFPIRTFKNKFSYGDTLCDYVIWEYSEEVGNKKGKSI